MADRREPLEVVPLAGEERVPLEVRDDALEDVLEAPRLPLQGLVAPIGSDASASEVRLDRMKHLGAISVLADGEAWPHLPSDTQRSAWGDGNGEAAFAVGVSGEVHREVISTVVPRAGV
jgi:hypothetical protein